MCKTISNTIGIGSGEIERLKEQLAATDYKAIKHAEGWLTAEEYATTKAQRQQWRERINELEGGSDR